MNAHNEQQARKLLALGLDEFGHHTEAANVRKGIDLDDYKVNLWAIRAALDAQPAAAQEADGARARLHEIAYRDTAVSVTVRADDLRALLAEHDEVGHLRWLLRKARSVALLCDPAVRWRQPPAANSLEAMAYSLIHEIDAAIPAGAVDSCPAAQEAVAVVDGPDRGASISSTATLIRAMPSGTKLYVAPVIAATAWAEGYASGVIDERTSDANIGIAGFGAKVDPARANPYLFAAPVTAAPPKCPACASLAESYCCNCGWASASTATAPAVAYMVDGRNEQGLTFDKAAADTMALANAGTVRPLGFIDSTPAAPGIDLTPFRLLVEGCEAEFTGAETEELEPDDSKVSYPEDRCHITFGMIRNARKALYASPKGDEARDAARYRFLRDVAHPDSDDGIAVTIQKQDSWGNWRDMHLYGAELDAGIDAAMQAQASDAEVRP